MQDQASGFSKCCLIEIDVMRYSSNEMRQVRSRHVCTLVVNVIDAKQERSSALQPGVMCSLLTVLSRDISLCIFFFCLSLSIFTFGTLRTTCVIVVMMIILNLFRVIKEDLMRQEISIHASLISYCVSPFIFYETNRVINVLLFCRFYSN